MFDGDGVIVFDVVNVEFECLFYFDWFVEVKWVSGCLVYEDDLVACVCLVSI